MADPKPLSRAQLAKFLPDEESIRRFEQAFKQIQNGQNDLSGLYTAISGANSRSAAAMALAVQAMAKTAPVQLPRQPAYLDFPSGAAVYPAARRIWWSEDAGTHQIGLAEGVAGDICQQLDYHVKNTGGSTILKGQSVMATGALGASGKITVSKAVADGSIASHYMIGVAAHDIPNNGFGYVVHFGLVRGFNTSGAPYSETWADGDLLYFSASTVGGLTKVEPSAPALKVPVAMVIKAAAGASGSVFVRMQGGHDLHDIRDVHAPSPAAGSVLIYDATQARWESATVTPGSNITITNADGAITVATSGYTGSFVAGTKTVTVNNGIITSVV